VTWSSALSRRGQDDCSLEIGGQKTVSPKETHEAKDRGCLPVNFPGRVYARPGDFTQFINGTHSRRSRLTLMVLGLGSPG